MVSFLHPESVPVEALGVDSSQAVWLGEKLCVQQEKEALAAGLHMGTSDDVVTVSPGAAVTQDALRRFVSQTHQVTGDVVGSLAEPYSRWSSDPCFGPPAQLYRFRGGGAVTESRRKACTPVVIDVTGKTIELPSADAPGGRQLSLDLSDAVLVSTHHWSGLLWLNLLSLGPTLWKRLVGSPWRLAWKLPIACLRTRSFESTVVAGAMSVIERGARVHPSAIVEGAWIQKGARIGPGAVVRGSIIGVGARVEPQALVGFSVLGANAFVQRRGWIQYGLVHGGASVGGAMQLGVLAPDSSFKHGSYLMDQSIRNDVQTVVNGERFPAPLGILGVGVGARTLIGSGVWVAPGRTLPGDLTIVAGKGGVLTKIPPTAKGALSVRDGTLVPL